VIEVQKRNMKNVRCTSRAAVERQGAWRKMIDSEDDRYVCTLKPASVEKAARELFEDPRQRLGALQTLRQWISQQSHMKCRTGDRFSSVRYIEDR
jgi:hypothetical protein